MFLQYLLGEELGKGVANCDGSSIFLGGNLLGGSLFLGNDLLFGLGFFNVPGEKKRNELLSVGRQSKECVQSMAPQQPLPFPQNLHGFGLKYPGSLSATGVSIVKAEQAITFFVEAGGGARRWANGGEGRNGSDQSENKDERNHDDDDEFRFVVTMKKKRSLSQSGLVVVV